jgi:hypothetical protein
MTDKSLLRHFLLALVLGSALTSEIRAQPDPEPGATPVESVPPALQAATPDPSPDPVSAPVDDVEAPQVTTDVPAPSPQPQPTPVAEPVEARDAFSNLNIYLPEGEFDIRLRRLIKNVLFEGQVSYNFVDGDISTFLRYKYYAKNVTYKIGVFDTLEFESIDDGSGDFDRVRGALLQFEYPSNYDSRYFLLFQGDRLLFGDVDNPDNSNDNLYVKLGYQFGTPFDERLNSIVGESRGRATPVLTTYRDLGRQRLGFAIAATQSFDTAGDYSYTKLEGEMIKRFDLGSTTFLVSRLHAGTFLAHDPGELPSDLGDTDLIDQPTYLFSIPRYEYFRLGGRDSMKSLDSDSRGTEEVHLSNELFAPVFRNRGYRTGSLTWTNLYGIVYAGAGSVGFDSDEAELLSGYKFGDLVIDAGLGFEASVELRDSEFLVSAIYARTVQSPEGLESNELRFAVRTKR